MEDIIIISYENNKVLTSINYYENTELIEDSEQSFDYCTKCEILIKNKFLIQH